MSFEFKLPDLGEGVMEGEIVKWLVKPGDDIAEDTPVVELMTDKATIVIPSPKAGKVLQLFGKEGEMAKVHHAIVTLDVSQSSASTAGSSKASAVPAPVALKPSSLPSATTAASHAPRVLATPLTRRMAKEHGISLQQVVGSGHLGRILKVDVERHLSQNSISPSTLRLHKMDERIPLRGLRKRIAEKMVKSKFTAPHYAFVEEVDMTQVSMCREDLNTELKSNGNNLKVSFLPFFLKAVIKAFAKYPQVNAHMDEAAQELVVKGSYHLGIAAMTPNGLMVPVLKNADSYSLPQMAQKILDLGQAAREQKLSPDELSGSTFTVTSLGQTGGLFATPIINHPEVAIMGVHRMRKRPVVMEDNSIAVRPIALFSFCFDHRVIDGAVGAEFAYEVLKYIERPHLLFMDV